MGILQDIVEGLRIFQEYDSESRVQILEDEIRVTLLPGVSIGQDDYLVLEEFGWRYSEGDWVRWV